MAARFFVNGGTNNNWSSTSNWSTTSGGVGGSAVPTSSDAVTFDTNSPNCTIDTAANAASITWSTYTNTITFSNSLTVAGNITLGASMTFAGTSQLISTASATLTSNGKSLGVPFSVSQGVVSTTLTLADSWILSSDLTVGTAGFDATFNGNTLSVGGNFVLGRNVSGTTTIILAGTGTVSQTNNNQGDGISSNLTINTSGTITFSGSVGIIGGTFTYTSGTVITTGSTIHIDSSSGGPTFDCAGITWDNVTINLNSGTMTLNADFNCINLTTGNNGSNQTINGHNINISGNCTINNIGFRTLAGTTTFTMTGTGTLSMGTISTGGMVSNPIKINSSGTVTLSGNFYVGNSTFTYVAGTIVNSSFNLNVVANETLDGGGATINGLICTTAGTAITMKSTLIVDTTFTMEGTKASPITISSDIGGTLRKLTMATSSTGVTEDVIYTNPTDIDSRDGVAVFYAKGTLNNTFNWIGTNPGVAKSGGVLVIGGGTTKLSSSGFTGGVFGG